MSSLFNGLNIVKNALTAQTQVLNITGHNVSNASTEGYSRQTVQLVAISGDTGYGNRSLTDLSIGSGVDAKAILRSRSALYDEMYRDENQQLNNFSKTEDMMGQIESLFNEPSDTGFSDVLDSFFNGWQDLANDPSNMAARESLKSTGQELTDRIHRLSSQLLTIRQDIDTEISTIPESINGITKQIAELNTTIRLTEAQGGSANDLRDQRDTLVDDLTQYSDVRAVEQSDGTYTVLIGSKVVVEHESSTDLTSISTASDGHSSLKTVIRSANGTEYSPTGGSLGALINFRDTVIEDALNRLDTLSASLVEAVNTVHNAGYGLDGENNRNFFDPSCTKAFNITLSDDISDVNAIAASGTGDVGDSSNALNMSALSNENAVNGQYTISEYYNTMIGDIGVQAQYASSSRANEELLVSQIDNSRESIKGVNIDDELIQMIQTQRVYQSASRVLVTIDSLLETLVNMK
jgi:flagellar hook-associated protein 1